MDENEWQFCHFRIEKGIRAAFVQRAKDELLSETVLFRRVLHDPESVCLLRPMMQGSRTRTGFRLSENDQVRLNAVEGFERADVIRGFIYGYLEGMRRDQDERYPSVVYVAHVSA